jgi:hypothetical protein
LKQVHSATHPARLERNTNERATFDLSPKRLKNVSKQLKQVHSATHPARLERNTKAGK